jgi:hypothetical protein
VRRRGSRHPAQRPACIALLNRLPNTKSGIILGVWQVKYLPEAADERAALPATERAAIENAVRKLESLGPDLPYPHTSAVQGTGGLRELRPRGGNSPWRPLYQRVGKVFVIAAIGPEARRDKRGFDRACQDARGRLAAQGDDQGNVRTEDRR